MSSHNSGSCNQGRGSESKTDKTRRYWSKNEEAVLIASLKELVAQGWKSDNGFRAGYLSKLEAAMAKQFPSTDLQGMPHINSKLTTWKKNYGSLTTMMAHSGVGFNLKGTHMIDCSNDLQKIIVKNDNNARTVRYREWPLLDDRKLIFGKDQATGESAEDVMEAVNDLLNEDNVPEGGNDGDYHVNLDDILGDEDVEENSVCEGDKVAPTQRSIGKKRKTIDGLDGVYELLGQLCRNTDTRLENIANRIGYEVDMGKAKTKVFDLLGDTPGLSLNDKFDVCEMMADKVEHLEIFMGLPEHARPQYVERLLRSMNADGFVFVSTASWVILLLLNCFW